MLPTKSRFIVNLACGLGFIPALLQAQEPVFVEENGLVIMEAESITTPTPWVKRTAADIPAGDPNKLNGFAGSGFIEWTGQQYFGLTTSNPDTPIRYNFQITNPGTYKLVWRTKQKDAGQTFDAGNDAFVRFATGTIPSGGRNFGIFTKIYVQNKTNWEVSANAEPGGNPKFVFNNFSRVLTAGNHAVEISGRSPGHVIDRLIIHRTDVPFNATQFATLPESGTTDGGGGSPGGSVTPTGSPTPIDNNPPVVNFDKTKDLFVAQFDSKPDPDDIQAIAAVGCMLAHPDLHNIDFYGVQGTVGLQGWNQFNGNNNKFIEATNLMNLAFGQGRWTQAGNGLRNSFPNNSNYSDYSPANTNWTASVTRVRDKAKAAIDRGGKVYVMEAGNSDFTHDWVQALQAMGVSSAATKQNVVVVQHSNWNENQTTTTNRVGAAGNETIPGDRTVVLNWVRANTDYRRIADGNGNNATPAYNTNQTQWALSAEANDNPNSHARALWIAAENAMNTVFSRSPDTYPGYSNIRFRGAVDFSDTCEAWYIFNRGTTADNISKFWSRYVRNTDSTNGPVPRDFNALIDSVSGAQLEPSVSSANSFTVTVPYTATTDRDVNVAIIEPGGTPSWRGAGKTTVSAGSDTASVTVNITNPNTDPLVPGSYQWVASIREVNQSYQTNKDEVRVDFTVTSNTPPPVEESVSCVNLPSSTAAASSFDVAIPYTSNPGRQVYVSLFRRDPSANAWLGGTRTNVNGSDTIQATVNLSAGIPAQGSNYFWGVTLVDPGQNWNGAVSCTKDVTLTCPLAYQMFARDFPTTGNNFYLDNTALLTDVTNENALAINPATATTATTSMAYNGPAGSYDLVFRAVGENDGSSTFVVKINGVTLGTHNPPISTEVFEIGDSYNARYDNVAISPGDIVEVSATIASLNGEFSRARWLGIDFFERCPSTAYNEWKSNNFLPAELSNPAVSGNDADPGGNGLPNIVDYALGLDPRGSLQPNIKMEDVSPTEVMVSYDRKSGDRGGVVIRLLHSSDLSQNSWQDVNDDSTQVSSIGTGMEEAMHTVPRLQDADKQFYRLYFEY